MAYFLYHSIGTFPGKAETMGAALARFSTIWSAEDDGQWPEALTLRARFIRGWETLIGAPAGSMTTVENVTLALYSLIGALPEERLKGKRVLAAADCFPSLHFLLAGLQDRFGFTLDTVPMRQGESYVRDEDFLQHWGEDVGLALVTWVSSTTSKRADLETLSAHGSRMGSIVVADITQGVGIRPFEVADLDVVVGSSLKWLCGASGAGALYVRPDLLARCRPELRGWFSQPNPFSWDLDAFSYADDGRRFDHGTPAVLAAIASLPGLDFVHQTGVEALAAHNLMLTEMIVEAARASGLALSSPTDPESRGGSVMIRVTDAAQATGMQAGLRKNGIYCDCRGATLRFSPGNVTTRDQTTELCDQLARLSGHR
ncbi:aminotransferase class V-fold PLP-dependent enzyme [Rhizobium halophytocola]|uniref:Selenocysteine lyase/cysteine desulfurase n=1 Tax=Rhizobium halophytocola TaxID=735519 RepID=A0ABS4DV73_9HYPH|nr:aminotransferase class V-fold PLP-dependent enzyme [Rhizobium halophytocola]MBP1849577.1 selenocysteine lyase/cysteine desulfurase [Rhizobium halophytocola]